MDIAGKNIEICKFLDLKETKAGCFKFDGTKYKNLTQYKETSELKWHSSYDWVMALAEKVESIKDLTICIQGNYVSLFYKGKGTENVETPVFACSREKTTKLSAIYEVLSTFVLWYRDHPDIQGDILYDLHHVVYDENEDKNIIFMKSFQKIETEEKTKIKE